MQQVTPAARMNDVLLPVTAGPEAPPSPGDDLPDSIAWLRVIRVGAEDAAQRRIGQAGRCRERKGKYKFRLLGLQLLSRTGDHERAENPDPQLLVRDVARPDRRPSDLSGRRRGGIIVSRRHLPGRREQVCCLRQRSRSRWGYARIRDRLRLSRPREPWWRGVNVIGLLRHADIVNAGRNGKERGNRVVVRIRERAWPHSYLQRYDVSDDPVRYLGIRRKLQHCRRHPAVRRFRIACHEGSDPAWAVLGQLEQAQQLRRTRLCPADQYRQAPVLVVWFGQSQLAHVPRSARSDPGRESRAAGLDPRQRFVQRVAVLGATENFKFVAADKDQVVPTAPLAGGELCSCRRHDPVDQAGRTVASCYLQ